ncbi:LPS O-antigen chain length determinant protein WzzB [Halopseudomonas pelagia]|uniref:LPS O-antigen chain length determinant protein WzzB n=1 Tax=Halopseudomonas pelagia TaxID=553151 RepID=UPI0015839444|nr:Wzz/FepE/Etk N-terminal domain-containing protein [Halopseudomonas pelagia]
MTTIKKTPPHSSNDELDLLDVAQDLWQQKYLIAVITVAVMLIAVGYAFLATPVYQSTVSVIPPRAADIAPVNLGRERAEIDELDIKEAYSIFTRNLNSQTSRRWFFEERYRPYLEQLGITGTRDNLMERMGGVLRVNLPDARNNPDNYVVRVHLSDPELAAKFANDFVAEVSKRSIRDLELDTRAQVANKLRAFEEHIHALRMTAKAERLDRVARLEEALKVAEAIGLQSPEVTGGRTQISVGSSGSAQVSDGSMLFLNGIKAIGAELALLKARENDDPFISELRDIQQKIAMLNLVDPIPEFVQLFTLDSAAEVSENPVKPQKANIVMIGITVGGGLAGLVALFRAAIRRRKHEVQTGER